MAGGTFSSISPPNAPGFYVNFEAVARAVITGGTNGTVLIPFTADWGPEKTFVDVTSTSRYDALFSDSEGGTGRFAVLGALKGLGGRPGASKVLAYRLVGSAGAAGSLALRNGADDANFVTLTAKYKGARSNRWTVSVSEDPLNAGSHQLVLMEDGVEIERHSVLGLTPADWVAAIDSKYFIVTAGPATDVNYVSGVEFNTTVGNSGTSLLQSDWTAFQTAAESQTFNVVAPANLTDAAIRSALVSWTVSRNVSGQRFMLVIGGAAGETLSAAVTRSISASNENVVNLGYTDLFDLDGSTISTAKFAPRMAGIIADAGVTRSVTQQRVSDVTLKVAPTSTDIDNAYAAGVMLFVSDSLGPRIHQDLTTYVSNSLTKPRVEFGKIKAVRTHHQIESDLTMAANNGWLGGDNVNIPTVQTVILSGIADYLRNLEDNGVIKTGWVVALDNEEDNSGNALHLRYGISTVKAIEQIFNTIVLA